MDQRGGRGVIIITTFCSSFIALSWLGAGSAQAATEVELLRRALSMPTLQAELAAVEARGEAQGSGPALLANPELTARHEQEGGGASTTDALGGALSFDLGLSTLAERQAADLRGRAAPSRSRAAVLDAICTVRGAALDQWQSQEQLRALEEALARLERLERDMGRLAEAGESSGYDRDRVALARLTLAVERDRMRVEAAHAAAALAGWTGEPVPQLSLAPSSGAAGRGEPASDPTLAALRLERDAAQRSLAASRRSTLPDLVIEGGARWDTPANGGAGNPGFELGGALELPLFDWNRAGRSDAQASLREAEAALLRREAELRARVEAARLSVEQLGAAPTGLDAEAVWTGAVARYVQGEASIDELLEAAQDVAEASAAMAVGEALRRRAALDLSCALGSFPEPEIHSLYEELAR